MTVMTIEDLRQMLLFVADRMISSKPYLTEVDSKIGDGDHGIGMEIGLSLIHIFSFIPGTATPTTIASKKLKAVW